MSQTILDDTQPGGPKERTIVYEAPFDRCDRERDYELAWAHFEKRFGGNREYKHSGRAVALHVSAASAQYAELRNCLRRVGIPEGR